MSQAAKQQKATRGVQHSALVQIIPAMDGERDALAMENLLQACSSERPFSLELCGTSHVQGFLLRAQDEQTLTTLCLQVQAQYPQAVIRDVRSAADPLRLHRGEQAYTATLALTGPEWMPIKTLWNRELSETGTDFLLGILAAMERVHENERIVTQISLIRAPDHWGDRYKRKTVEHPLAEEQDAKRVAQASSGGDPTLELLKILLLLFACIGGLQGYLWYRAHAWLQIGLGAGFALVLLGALGWWWLHRDHSIYDMKLVNEKLLRVAFYAQIRIIIIGPKEQPVERFQWHLSRLEQAYRQFNLSGANGLKVAQIKQIFADDPQAFLLPSLAQTFTLKHSLLHMLSIRRFVLLNTREIGGMYHLPQEEADVPLIERLATRRLLASPDLAHHIQQEEASLSSPLVGYSQQRGQTVPVYFPEFALFSHKFFVAKSRYGKSVFVLLLLSGVMKRIRAGGTLTLQPGVVVVDPHRDLFEDSLRLVPKERANDVMLIDLADTQYPIGLNLLDAGMGLTADQAVANAMSAFHRAWQESWGPRMAYYLTNFLRTLFYANAHLCQQGHRDEQYTLLDINPMLQNIVYAKGILAHLDATNRQEMEILAWWRDVFFKLPNTGTLKQEILSPILSKMGIFSDNLILQRIVGQAITTVDLTHVVNEGCICLISLASKDIDESAVSILGATLVNLLARHVATQADVPLLKRRKIFLAIDEFQNIPGADFDKMLSEYAKYGLACLLTSQNLKRLNRIREGLLDIVMSTCEQIAAFSCSASDAEVLEEELHGRVETKHIINQPRLHCYLRLVLPDRPVQIASLQLAQPESWDRSPAREQQAEAIRCRCQSHYLPQSIVDARLTAHVRSYLDVEPYADGLKRDAQQQQAATKRREADTKREQEILDAQHTGKGDIAVPQGEGTNQVSETPVTGTTISTPPSTTSTGLNVSAKSHNEKKKRSRPHPRNRRRRQQQTGQAPPLPRVP